MRTLARRFGEAITAHSAAAATSAAVDGAHASDRATPCAHSMLVVHKMVPPTAGWPEIARSIVPAMVQRAAVLMAIDTEVAARAIATVRTYVAQGGAAPMEAAVTARVVATAIASAV